MGQGSQLVTRRIILVGGGGNYSETLEITRRHIEDDQFLQMRLLLQIENKEPYFVTGSEEDFQLHKYNSILDVRGFFCLPGAQT